MEDLPLDVQKQWHNVTRRMQSVAKSEGLSVLTLRVLVKADGTPVIWNVDKHMLEPKSLQETILEMFDIDKKN